MDHLMGFPYSLIMFIILIEQSASSSPRNSTNPQPCTLHISQQDLFQPTLLTIPVVQTRTKNLCVQLQISILKILLYSNNYFPGPIVLQLVITITITFCSVKSHQSRVAEPSLFCLAPAPSLSKLGAEFNSGSRHRLSTFFF